MANKKISDYADAGLPLAGTEMLEIETWEGLSLKVSAQDIADLGTSAGSGVWGSITGTLADQTDLASALNGKLPTSPGAVGPINLSNTGVSPGSYISANITVDAQGRITAAADGGGGGSSSAWGSITGTISDQTDLQSELDGKADSSDLDDFVSGPATSDDNSIPRFDGSGGKTLQASGVLVDDADAISGYKGAVNRQTGTSYTLLAADSGKIIELANAAAITLTLPNSLPAGFCCTIVQDAAGQVTLAVASGATIKNRQSHTKLAGNGAFGTLYVSSNAGSAAAYRFGGDTVA